MVACDKYEDARNDNALLDHLVDARERCSALGLCPGCEALVFLNVALDALRKGGVPGDDAARLLIVRCADVYGGKVIESEPGADTEVEFDADVDTDTDVYIGGDTGAAAMAALHDRAIDLFHAYACTVAAERMAAGKIDLERARKVVDFDVTTFRAALAGVYGAEGARTS